MKKIILLSLILINLIFTNLYAQPDGYYKNFPYYEMDRIKPLIDNIYDIRYGVRNARKNNFSKFYFLITHDFEEKLNDKAFNDYNEYLISIRKEVFEYDYVIENIYIDHDLMMVKLINSH